ncbi:hypothetical protein B0H11DRAFT_2412305 [Mycena galericulata]|nr:hypothetical protein B0H11DRAFT_2412305 [Mycena galericulata]
MLPRNGKKPDTAQEDHARPIKKKKLSQDSDTPSLAPTTRIDILVICPGNYCKDVVPVDLPLSVLALFAQKRDLVNKDGPTAPGCAQLTKQICQAIKMESMYTRRLAEAKDAGWPISIDFDELPPRISALFPSLPTLLSDSTVLARSPVWNKLFNGDLPEKVDIVVAANPESSQPPRHRTPAVNLKLPAPKAITLEKFPPPAVREKKPVKKVGEKPKNSTSPKKSKQEKAEVKIPASHGYGTRGAKTTT